MSTTLQQSPTARGQQRWFFGMLAVVKASSADTGGRYTFVEMTAPAGLQVPLHVHHTEDEGFYVVEGSITVQLGDELIEVGGGEHAYGPHGIPHRFTVGPDGARMLWILAPGGFEDFIEEVSVPAETPTVPPAHILPPENAAEIVLKHGNELLPG
ncbi:MAG TPA: cupin domain-containing protein [Solirubrobacteraceae bacterium]|nr:cupin domain-containing protein [Solirubrobacteraceae bacterium]